MYFGNNDSGFTYLERGATNTGAIFCESPKVATTSTEKPCQSARLVVCKTTHDFAEIFAIINTG
jgi:hypothetical protein